jgi:hypothetical protein
VLGAVKASLRRLSPRGLVATFALRFQPLARRYYDRKRARACHALAIKALAHKLARASYWMLRDQTAYDPTRLFR